VTEPPIEEGEYWGWDAHDGVFITHYNPDRDYDDDWAWSDWSGEMIPVDMWSPSIPPPPPSNSTGLAPLTHRRMMDNQEWTIDDWTRAYAVLLEQYNAEKKRTAHLEARDRETHEKVAELVDALSAYYNCIRSPEDEAKINKLIAENEKLRIINDASGRLSP
jgi:hypothetical protein